MPSLNETTDKPFLSLKAVTPWSVGTKLLICTVAAAVPTFAVFAIRVSAMVSRGEFTDAVCEAPPIYSIWKVQEGYTLYEFPNRDNYCVTFYNFGFYYFYAYVLKWVGACGNQIVLYGRFLTLVLAFVGSGVSYLLMKSFTSPLNKDWRQGLLLGLFAIFIWFGSSSAS